MSKARNFLTVLVFAFLLASVLAPSISQAHHRPGHARCKGQKPGKPPYPPRGPRCGQQPPGRNGGAVLGSQLGERGATVAGTSTGSGGSALPFTGGDLLIITSTGLVLLATGSILVRRARRGTN